MGLGFECRFLEEEEICRFFRIVFKRKGMRFVVGRVFRILVRNIFFKGLEFIKMVF